MLDDHRLYWIWLAESFRQGNILAAKLVQRYGGAAEIYDGAADDIKEDEIFTAENVTKIKKSLRDRSLVRAEQILARCEQLGISVITPQDDEFPAKLKTLHDMPMVLYVLGKLPDCDTCLLTTIVGTRKMSDYGRKIAYSLGAGLAFGGAVVVSGMALGADSMALIGALDAGGNVVAVLGSGVDVIYPADHKEIYRKIAERGAIVSEYPPGSPPIGSHFPVRNRIMSGISDATVVVEGSAFSGAMITAKHAITQGRKLFAVPGNVGDEGSEGTNMLLREGAIPVLCAEDILCEFEFIYSNKINIDHANNSLRGLDMDKLSLNAMSRTRIGTGSGKVGAEKNYYGSGSYGGRAPKKTFDDVSQNQGSAQTAKISGNNTQRQTASKKEKANVVGAKNLFSGIISGLKDKNEPKKEKITENSDKKVIPARKIELDMLDESEIKVYNKMKPNVPMLPDELVDENTTVADVMSALTMLEMAGAVDSGGGGYFMRTSPDDIMQSIND